MTKTITIDASDSELEAALVAARAMLAALKEAMAFSRDDDGPTWADSTIAKCKAAIAAAKAAGIGE